MEGREFSQIFLASFVLSCSAIHQETSFSFQIGPPSGPPVRWTHRKRATRPWFESSLTQETIALEVEGIVSDTTPSSSTSIIHIARTATSSGSQAPSSGMERNIEITSRQSDLFLHLVTTRKSGERKPSSNDIPRIQECFSFRVSLINCTISLNSCSNWS
jgi:hypothetical protein